MRNNLLTSRLFKTGEDEINDPETKKSQNSMKNCCLNVILDDNLYITPWIERKKIDQPKTMTGIGGQLLESQYIGNPAEYIERNESLIRQEEGEDILKVINGKELELIICVTIYKETIIDLNDTLEGIRENLFYFNKAGKIF